MALPVVTAYLVDVERIAMATHSAGRLKFDGFQRLAPGRRSLIADLSRWRGIVRNGRRSGSAPAALPGLGLMAPCSALRVTSSNRLSCNDHLAEAASVSFEWLAFIAAHRSLSVECS